MKLSTKLVIFFLYFFSKSHGQEAPKISIITSLYNGDQYIREFLQDITRQTIFDQCELIIINANSPGNEEPVIKQYMQKFPNIVYKKLDERITIYNAWNLGVKMAQANILTNANLDDRRSPNSLEKHLKGLEENPSADLVYADFYVSLSPNQTFEMLDNTPRKRLSLYNHPSSSENIATIMYNPQFSYNIMLRWNLAGPFPMWRKSLHDKYGLFRNDFVALGDWEMWLRATKSGARFLKIHSVLDVYYLNPKGLSTDLSSGKVLLESDIINRLYRQ